MNKKGFTLVELIAVIIIMAAIALFAFPSIINLIDNNQTNEKEEALKNLYIATENYILNEIEDKTSLTEIAINDLVINNYVTIAEETDFYDETDFVLVTKDNNGVYQFQLDRR